MKMPLSISQAVSSIVLLGVSIATAGSQLSGDFKGSLALAFFNQGSWHTNFFTVDLQTQPPRWHLTLRSPDKHKEAFADSDGIEIVNYYDDVVPTKNGLNTAEIKLFPTPRPVRSPCEEHIWAALFSRDTFLGKKTPLHDMGLRIEEPCVFTEIQFNSSDVSPRFAKWHNENADKYGHQTRIEGEFKWLMETNLSEAMALPLKSELGIYIISTNGERTPVSYSQLTIETIAPLASVPKETPAVKGRSPVYDYRFGGPFGRTYVTYDVHDGVIPTTNARFVQNAKMATKEFRTEENQTNPKRRFFILFAVVVTSVGFAFFAVKTRKQADPKQQRE